MTSVLIGIAIAVAVSLVIQSLLALGFSRSLAKHKVTMLADKDCKPATVVLCLRGGDPFLPRCIQGIVSQDYPNFRVLFVVDHEQDPALAILQDALSNTRFENYQIEFLKQPLSTCSLKCSSLLQALRVIDNRMQFVAFIDADTIAHATWLRELATALEPEHVGAVTGNRWYMPSALGFGPVVRSAWNIAAVVQMYWYEIAWGGTLAVKLDSIRRANLTERWSQSFCEDTMLRKQLASIGQKVKFVPSLMMVNREDCTLKSFSSWVQRQLLTARLYHPAWPAVLFHGVSSTALNVCCWLCLFILLAQQQWISASLAVLLIATFNLVLTWLFIYLDRAVTAVVKDRGEPTNWRDELSFARLWFHVFMTQWVYAKDLFFCSFMRQVQWRGVTYSIDGPWKIRLHSYHPYQESPAESAQALESL